MTGRGAPATARRRGPFPRHSSIVVSPQQPAKGQVNVMWNVILSAANNLSGITAQSRSVASDLACPIGFRKQQWFDILRSWRVACTMQGLKTLGPSQHWPYALRPCLPPSMNDER